MRGQQNLRVKIVIRLLIGLVVFGRVPLAFTDELEKPGAIAVKAWRQAHESRVLDEFIQLLRLPNVSQDKPNILRNAEHLIEMMQKRGLNPRLLQVPDATPVVYGEMLAEKPTATYVFYAHYDGQPADAKEWASPPFEPVLRTGRLESGGKVIPFPKAGARIEPDWRIYARSAADDKNSIMAMLAAVDALQASGIRPTVNLKFFFEGEEEIGSTNLEKILALHKELLQGDLWIICDGPVHASGRQNVVFGVRGIKPLEITVHGANRDLHSGQFGNWAPNPAMMLAQLLASMKDQEGRVLIDGFYEGVAPLTDTERKALDAIPFNDAAQMQTLGLARVDGGGAKLAELITLPSFNVRGLSAGRVAGQIATIIPASATAAIDIRLMKGVTRERAVSRVLEHIRKQGFHVTTTEPDEDLRLRHQRIAQVVVPAVGYEAVRTSMDIRVARKVVASIESVRKPLVLQPTLGGSLPLEMIERVLQAPMIVVPMANHDNNQHAKNENLRLQNLWDSIEVLAALMTTK